MDSTDDRPPEGRTVPSSDDLDELFRTGRILLLTSVGIGAFFVWRARSVADGAGFQLSPADPLQLLESPVAFAVLAVMIGVVGVWMMAAASSRESVRRAELLQQDD